MRFASLIALLFPGVLALTTPVAAAPMHTELDEALDTSSHIVVATFVGQVDPSVPAHEATEFRIEVVESLRGDRPAGEWVVKRGEHGTPGGGDGEFVAFVGADEAWNYVAIPQTSGPLEESWFVLQGFYDVNAHVVRPGMLTWPQLSAVIAGKPVPDAVFEGVIWFLDDAGMPTASDVTLTVKRSFDGESSKVSGMPRLKDLPKQPRSVGLGPGWRPALRLAYGANNDRPLDIVGEITGIADGVLQTRFRVAEPMLITERLFDAYRKDPDTSGVLVGLKVEFDDGGGLGFEWSDGTQRRRGPVEATGTVTALPDDLTARGVGYAPQRELTFSNGSERLVIEVDEPPAEATRLAERGGALVSYLLELLQNDGLRCTVRLEDNTGAAIWTQRGRLGVDRFELAPDWATLQKQQGSP